MLQTILYNFDHLSRVSTSLESKVITDLNLLQINRILMDVPDIPEAPKDAFYPMDQFFNSEATIFQDTIDTIVGDIAQLLEAARGSIPATPELRNLLNDVSQQRVPLVWQKESYPSCVPLAR